MSQYKKIATEFKNPDSLMKALADLGLPFDKAPDLKVNSLQLEGWGGRPAGTVAIRVPKSLTGGYEDVGFSWTGSAYEAHVSTHDGEYPGYNHRDVGEPTLLKIKQRYALHELRRQARQQGYSIQEKYLDDGSIRLICTQY